MLEDPDGAGPFAEDLRGRLDAEVAKDSQEHHLGLGAGKIRDQGKRLVERLSSLKIGLCGAGELGLDVWLDWVCLSPRRSPPGVHQSPPGDGEYPSPECLLVSLEAAQPASHLDPNVGREVVRRPVSCRGSQIAQQPRMKVAPKLSDRPFLAPLRGAKRGREPGVSGRAPCGTQRPYAPETPGPPGILRSDCCGTGVTVAGRRPISR